MRKRKAKALDQSSEVLSFLTEFARLLMAAGLTSVQFHQVAELAFFRAASYGSRFQNSRINQSSISAMTGLRRPKIRALMRAETKKLHSQSKSQREVLIAAWMTEAEFLTESGQPRRLRLTGSKGSFASLAKKYGGDIPSTALLRDLARRKLVRVSGDHAQLANNAREVRDIRRLEQVSAAFASALSTPDDAELGRAFKLMSFEIRHPAPSAVGRILLQRRIASSLKVFMAELDAACNAIALAGERQEVGKRRTSKTSVILLNQD